MLGSLAVVLSSADTNVTRKLLLEIVESIQDSTSRSPAEDMASMTQTSTCREEHGTGRLRFVAFEVELVTIVRKNRYLTQPKNFESGEEV